LHQPQFSHISTRIPKSQRGPAGSGGRPRARSVSCACWRESRGPSPGGATGPAPVFA
jgi:hypothetical protein